MRRGLWAAALAAWALAAPGVLLAQGRPARPAVTAAPAPEPGADMTVAVITMGPGDAIWELFGHNAIWIRDPANGIDLAYNWGMFNFRQENFFLNFARGRMRYWMAGYPAEPTIEMYRRAGRAVWVQTLNLTPAEKVALRDALLANDTPENRYYRYDYYRDNCSTRVRDAIDRVLGGQLRAQTDTIPTGTTYRSHTKALTASSVTTYLGLQLLLGRPTDRPISAWEETFLPLQLRHWLGRATRTLPDGRVVPLVADEATVATGTHTPPRTSIPGGIWGFLGTSVAVAALLVILSGAKDPSAARTIARIGASIWALIAGIGGIVSTGLWFFTDHAATYANANVLVASIFALPLAVVLWRRREATPLARGLAGVVAALAVVAVVLGVLPGHQQNGEVLACFVPLDVALAVVIYRLGATRSATA